MTTSCRSRGRHGVELFRATALSITPTAKPTCRAHTDISPSISPSSQCISIHAAPACRSTLFFTTRSVHRGISAGSRLRQAARCSACNHSQRVKTRLRQGLSLRNAYRLLHRGVETESSAGDESKRQVQEDPDACQGKGQGQECRIPDFPADPGNVTSTQWLSSLPRVEKFFGR